VVNLSLGSASDPGTTVRQAFTNAYAKGLVIVASAGNAGSGTDTVGFPAKYDSVIAVASTTSSDGRSNFSSTGPAVEIAAPGSSIYSTDLGRGYYTASGTSMAVPHVAGVAALILGAGISDLNGNTFVNDEVRWVLQTTANDLGTEGRDEWFGFGLADAEAAVWLAANANSDNPPPVPAVFDPPPN
jgi:subtilisin